MIIMIIIISIMIFIYYYYYYVIIATRSKTGFHFDEPYDAFAVHFFNEEKKHVKCNKVSRSVAVQARFVVGSENNT